MVIKQLACVLRLSDGCTGKPLQSGAAAVYLGESRLRCEYKDGGYFVITDLDFGEYVLEIKAVGFQTEKISISVTDAPSADIIFLTLNPSRLHPAAGNKTCVEGRAPDVGTLYVVREQGRLCVAEEKCAAGAQEIRMFVDGNLALPTSYLLGDGAHSEIVTITANNGGICRTAQPLKYAHKRSESAFPLIRVQCEDDFFVMLPDEFAAAKIDDKIPLRFAAIKKGKTVFARTQVLLKTLNYIGEISLKGEK